MQVDPKYWVAHRKAISFYINSVLKFFPFRKIGTKLLMNLGYSVAKANGKVSCV